MFFDKYIRMEEINAKIAMIHRRQHEYHIIRPVLDNIKSVFLGDRERDGRGILYALKLKDISINDNFSQELKIVDEFRSNKEIISYDNWITFKDESHRYILIQMKYYQHLDLFNYLEMQEFNISEEMIIEILYKSLKILKILKDHSVFHGKFILENLLVESEHPLKLVLTDFSSAIRYENNTEIDQHRSFVPCYCAPEFFEKNKCDYRSDIWSLGVFIYMLIFKKLPFEIDQNDHFEEISGKIRYLDIKFQDDVVVSEDLLHFLYGALEKDPNRRIDVEDVLDMPFLQHFNDIDDEDNFQDNDQMLYLEQDYVA